MPPHPSNPSREPLSDGSQRWDRARVLPDLYEGGSRPSRLVAGAIVILCVVMTAGVVTLWRAGLWEPGMVSASDIQNTREEHRAITAALEAARVYMTRAEWGKAEAILIETAERHPIDQEVRIALAETYLGLQRHGDSYEQYAKALAIGPRDSTLEFTAGQVASAAGLHENAADHFGLAQRSDPYNTAYPLMLGMVERQLGRTDAAKASLLRAANLDPQNAFAWGTLADIALGENNLNLAIQHITRARQLQPESREWRLIEARARRRRGEPEAALMLLLTLESSQRREAPVVRQIAECYGLLNRHADAARIWAEGAEAHPRDAALAFEAAAAFDRAGDRARALEYGRRAKLLGHPAADRLLARLED
jgi:tetratricopeptide (TPR) repeat protein